MKKLLLYFILLIPFMCFADGNLKWKLDVAYKTKKVTIAEYDVVYNKVVPFTKQSYSSKSGKYALQEPSVIVITTKNATTGKYKTYYAPGIPDEELVIIDKDIDGGSYHYNGSTFYKKYHEIDFVNDEFNKNNPEEHDLRLVEYIKNHPDDETSAMIIALAFRGKNELMESTAKILGSNIKNGRLGNFIKYMINQEEIERFSWLKMSSFLKVPDYKLVPVYRVKVPSDRNSSYGGLTLIENPYMTWASRQRYEVNNYQVTQMLRGWNGGGRYEVSVSDNATYECVFNKPLYVEKAAHENKVALLVKNTGNVKEFIDREHARNIDLFQTMVTNTTKTSSEMENIAKTYSSGKLSYVGLEGKIRPNASEADKWRKRSLEKAEEERVEAQLEKERQEKARREEEKKAQLELQRKKEEQARVVEKVTKDLIKKYGKRDVEALYQGKVVIGMHEDIFALLIINRGGSLSLKSDYGTIKVYDIYEFLGSKWIGRVTIRNHRVAHMSYGKRWNN